MIEKREKIEQYAILFCIYAFVGWVYEVFLWAKDYHMYINRGFCFGPWLPVYGFGGLLILYFLGKRDWNPVIKFLSISAFAALIELIATYILDLIGAYTLFLSAHFSSGLIQFSPIHAVFESISRGAVTIPDSMV